MCTLANGTLSDLTFRFGSFAATEIEISPDSERGRAFVAVLAGDAAAASIRILKSHGERVAELARGAGCAVAMVGEEADHRCVSTATADGFGAYCSICGETLE